MGCTEADTLIGERSRLVVLSRARPGIRLPPGKRPLLLHWSFPPFAALTSVQWLTALDCPPVFCFPRYFSGVWAALFCRLLIEPPGTHSCPAAGATLYLVGPEIGQGQSVGLVSAIDYRRPLLWSYPPYWRLACEHTSCSWPPVSRLFLQFLHVHPNGLATNMAHWSSLPLRYEYCILGIRQFMQVCDMVAVAGRRIATFPALASRRCDVVLRRGRPAAPRGLAAAWWTIRESNS